MMILLRRSSGGQEKAGKEGSPTRKCDPSLSRPPGEEGGEEGGRCGSSKILKRGAKASPINPRWREKNIKGLSLSMKNPMRRRRKVGQRSKGFNFSPSLIQKLLTAK